MKLTTNYEYWINAWTYKIYKNMDNFDAQLARQGRNTIAKTNVVNSKSFIKNVLPF